MASASGGMVTLCWLHDGGGWILTSDLTAMRGRPWFSRRIELGLSSHRTRDHGFRRRAHESHMTFSVGLGFGTSEVAPTLLEERPVGGLVDATLPLVVIPREVVDRLRPCLIV